jgi:hypothetical protein
MKNYAFINGNNVVVQVIIGLLDEAQKGQFLRDYYILFGAQNIIEVESGATAWIGGSYTPEEGFLPPPPPPEPEIVEGTSEEIIEQIVEGTTNDAA